MKKILFVCNFNSVHARTYIGYFAQRNEFDVCVVSTFTADEMDGVHLIRLTEMEMATRGIAASMARSLGRIHPTVYKRMTVHNRKQVTKSRIEKAEQIELPFQPDIIHSHRSQPEGIVGVNFAHKYPQAKFFHTTWGQDFVYWARSDSWLNQQTHRIAQRLDYAFPDNKRDARILREDYGYKNELRVMPATGGLDVGYLESQFELAAKPVMKSEFNFLSVRGYENNTIRITSLLSAFKLFLEKTGVGHFFLDTHFPGDKNRNLALLNKIRKLELQDDVTVLHLRREEMLAYMKYCDYYVSDTNADGLPLSILESLFFGQTPIVFDHESTEDLKSQFCRYYCFDNHDTSSILAAWLDAYEAGKMTEQERTTNKETIVSLYNRDSNLDEIASLYFSC